MTLKGQRQSQRDTSLKGEIPYEGVSVADLRSGRRRALEKHETCFMVLIASWVLLSHHDLSGLNFAVSCR